MATSDDKAATLHQNPSFTSLNVAARNNVQATNASAAKMPCTDLCSCYNEKDEPCQNILTEVIDDDEGNV